MYRDRPKSPSITQSTEETNTLRAAMSLENIKIKRKAAIRPESQVLLVISQMQNIHQRA